MGSYRGFELSLRFDTFHNEHQALLKGTLKYPVPLGSDPHGNIVRLDNALSNFCRPQHRSRKRTGHPETAAGSGTGRGGKAVPAGGRIGAEVRAAC